MEYPTVGMLMFVSFGCFGLIPLAGFIAYLLLMKYFHPYRDINTTEGFIVTCAVTLCTLFTLGVFKARFSNEDKFMSGLTMMANGAIASVAAFSSGVVLKVKFVDDSNWSHSYDCRPLSLLYNGISPSPTTERSGCMNDAPL